MIRRQRPVFWVALWVETAVMVAVVAFFAGVSS